MRKTLKTVLFHAIPPALVLARSLTVAKTVVLLVVLGSVGIPRRPHGGGNMAGGKLTDNTIKNAKPGERLAILSDGGGLQL
jgi:hypothetical protein